MSASPLMSGTFCLSFDSFAALIASLFPVFGLPTQLDVCLPSPQPRIG